MPVNTDEKYMRIAIKLAARARGLTNPNPAVGALIVKDDKIIGKGYHERAGLPHAEINALNEAGKAAKDASLYVTLEPCDHFGRTPPCTDAIIRSGIRKVIVGMKDPNPINNGRGIKKINRCGIKTKIGILGEEALSLNRPYLKFITKKIPYVTVKIAESLDGKIATRTGDSKWISSEDSRRYVHRLRGRVDAVMVGFDTVKKDDPLLISKLPVQKQPIRIIVDTYLNTPLDAKVFSHIRSSPVMIATTKKASMAKRRLYEDKGAKLLFAKLKNGKIDLKNLFKTLGKIQIMHIMVEGGGELIASLVKEKLVDQVLFFIAPKIVGGKDAITPVEGRGVGRISDAVILKNLKIKKFEKDILINAEVR